MTDDTTATERDVTRRRLLRRGVVAATAPALATVAAGQTENGSGESDGATETAAIPASAPTFGHRDYTGLFVHITGTDSEADTSGIGQCEFLGKNEAPAAFHATLIDRLEEESTSRQITVVASAEDTTLDAGRLYVINTQRACPSDYVTVELEQVGRSTIEAPTTTTESAIPGFGPLAAVAGIGGAAVAALRRARSA